MADESVITVNGVLRPLSPEPPRSLLSVLRDELGLTGAKLGCGEGECGACTVLVDGQPVKSCHVYATEAMGRSVTTIEGLAPGGAHPVQRAFVEEGAFQCGYCTPGLVMNAVALLGRVPDPDDAEITDALSGNLCRCGTYPRIRRAVHCAARLTALEGAPGGTSGTAADSHAADWTGGRAADSEPGSERPRPRRPWDLAEAGERDWFAVLPDGLVVAWDPRTAEPAGAGGRGTGHGAGGGWGTGGGAWLHVAADGRVTAFTGKVNLGQDNRTALSLLVADELRAPLSAVRLVMGDTDVCPYDMGTFGSRSVPEAGEALRHAAASARERLLDLAAERWEVARGDVAAADGSVRAADGSRAAGYGELVTGLRLVAVAGVDAPDGVLAPGARQRIAGQPVRRVSGPAIVTGARRYASDLSRPGMLHGRVLRAPAVGSTLASVDVEAAMRLPGVTVVHDGDFVGVVVEDPLQAGRAMRAITATWDHEPQPSEAELWDYLRGHPAEAEGWEGAVHREMGDPDGAFADAPVALAATYTTAFVAHAPLETTVAIAEWTADRLTVWTTTQSPFGTRQELAGALGIAQADIRVIVPDVGGGFGGRHGSDAALDAARLARAVGRPVRVAWSRREEFSLGHVRPAALIDVRSAAAADGTITAWEMRNTNSGSFGLAGPYAIANQRLDYQPTESPLPQGPFRALAATANHFARESHVDELAHALGADPLELRLRHLDDERLADVLRAAADRAGWADRPRGAGAGMGIAAGVEKGARVATCVAVRVGDGGRLTIDRIVTAVECGAIVDPDGLANQVEGATVMGLGAATFEAIHFGDGVIRNGTFKDYRLARLGDVPPIEVVLLDRRDIPSAGCGETPIVAVAPAIANAIFAASGIRLRSLPLVPDGVVG